LLYGLVATGTMWIPFGAAPTAMPEQALVAATPGNVVVNGDFDEGVLGWEARSDFYGYGSTMEFTNSDGFALHSAGEMRLRVLSNEAEAPERLNFRQQVSLQAGQRYRLSVDARAAAPRLMSLAVQGENAAYGRIAIGEGDTFTVDTEMRTFQAVFDAPTSDPAAVLLIQFGHSSEDITIDNVVLETTELPLDPGSTVGGPAPAPVAPVPGAPGPGGVPAAAPGDGSLGAAGDLGGDATGAPVTPGAPAPGGLTPGVGSASPGNPSAPSAQNCAPAAYSAEINLCYDPTTGYVWDTNQGTWTLPPQVEWCGADERSQGNFNYWWPLLPACYSPVSGYAWNDTSRSWVFVGTNFSRGQGVGSDDAAGCAVSGAGAAGSGWAGLALLGLAGAAMVRRRR
jgi:MYXO-CTERM domain-containing protein